MPLPLSPPFSTYSPPYLTATWNRRLTATLSCATKKWTRLSAMRIPMAIEPCRNSTRSIRYWMTTMMNWLYYVSEMLRLNRSKADVSTLVGGGSRSEIKSSQIKKKFHILSLCSWIIWFQIKIERGSSFLLLLNGENLTSVSINLMDFDKI